MTTMTTTTTTTTTKTIEWPEWETIEWDRSTATLLNQERVMIRVDARPTNGVSVGGRHAKHGENFLIVYRKDLQAIEKLVANEEQEGWLRIAKLRFDGLFAEHVKACGGDKKVAEETRGFSVESLYHDLKIVGTKGGYPPLVSLDVGPIVPPPETAQSLAARASRETAAAFAEALEAHRMRAETAAMKAEAKADAAAAKSEKR